MHAKESTSRKLSALMAMPKHISGLLRKKGRVDLEAPGEPTVAPLCEGLLIAKDRRTTTGLRQSPHRRWVKSPNPAGSFFATGHSIRLIH